MLKNLRNLPIPAYMALIVLGLTTASILHAEDAPLYKETFEDKDVGSKLGNKMTSDGAAAWSASANTWEVRETPTLKFGDLGNRLGFRFLNPGNVQATSIEAELDGIKNYTVRIGYLSFNGQGAVFGIGVRNEPLASVAANSEKNIYTFTKEKQPLDSTAKIQIAYIDESGNFIKIGEIEAAPDEKNYTVFLTDIQIQVSGDTQRLYIGEEPFDDISRKTSGRPGDQISDYLLFYAKSSPSASAAIEFDNITITQTTGETP